jgi:protein-disulfide isomerase
MTRPFCTPQPRPDKDLSPMRHLALISALVLGSHAALAGDVGDMSAEDRAAFRAEVKAYLLENPDVIVEAMDVLRAREDANAAVRDLDLVKANGPALMNSPSDWVGGNPSGDITVVEFMDYRCGYCRKAYGEVAELIKSDGNIRFIVKEYPILGPESVISSQFAIAVRMLYGDAAYEAAHDALIALRGEANAETMPRLAAELGHDPAAVMAKMATPEVQAVIDANHALAGAMEISGTPTFVIDRSMLRGYVPLDGMRQIVADERAS